MEAKKVSISRQRAIEASRRIAAMDESSRNAIIEKIGQLPTIGGRVLSPKNSLLVWSQMEAATIVGGYRQWASSGRKVKEGVKGMSIFIPCNFKKAESEEASEDAEEKKWAGFMTATVFDVSQTEDVVKEATN